MNRFRTYWVWLLFCGALAACATAPASSAGENGGCEEGTEAVFFEQACSEERSLVALCTTDKHCGLYRCREVMAHLTVGRVVLVRGGGLALPGSQGGAQRYWGSAQELPEDTRPVLIIPWDYQPPPLLPSQQKMLEEEEAERRKPHEQHHIFSRAFREWFELKKINIEEYVIPLEVEKHRSIHRGPNGGPWNAAWYKFITEHDGAPTEDVFRYAGQLIYEFELFGPVRPYRRQLPQPMPPGH